MKKLIWVGRRHGGRGYRPLISHYRGLNYFSIFIYRLAIIVRYR